jgi:hypothetical protein
MAGIELLCGLAILVGFETSTFAWALAILLIITTALGYPYWLLEGTAADTAQYHFYKNLAIIAAYLLLAVIGPGRYSIDGLRGAATPACFRVASPGKCKSEAALLVTGARLTLLVDCSAAGSLHGGICDAASLDIGTVPADAGCPRMGSRSCYRQRCIFFNHTSSLHRAGKVK